MTRILFIVSSAREIVLADGASHDAGVFGAEALKSYDRFATAGIKVSVASVDGRPPQVDPYSLEPIFHYLEEDQDFLASITRTFMRHINDIRITLQHLTEFDLIAARRIFEALKRAGAKPDEARIPIEQSARKAWSETFNFVDLLSVDPQVTAKVSAAQLREIAGEIQADAKRRSNEIGQRFSTMLGFQKPIKFGDLSDDDMLGYDAIFVPGGYGPMIDLAATADVRRLLQVMHNRSRTIAAVGHGPAVLLSAGDRPDGLWLFDGYRMTAFTDEEEDQTRVGKHGMPWSLEAALKNRGAVFDRAPAAWTSHVVVDRTLITGQNPASAVAVADAVVKRVAVRVREPA
jgi:putative intracellular protease/amidase